MSSNSGIVSSHIEVTKSIQDEEKYVNVLPILDTLKRRSPIIISCAALVSFSALLFNFTKPSIYEGKFEILVKSSSPESSIASALSSDSNQAVPQETLDTSKDSSIDESTLLQLLQSPLFFEPIYENVKPDFPSIKLNQIVSNMVVSQKSVGRTATDVFEIKYQSSDPELVSKVLSETAQAYLNYSYDQRREYYTSSIEFLDSQMPKVELKVQNLERDLQIFREKNIIFDPDESVKSITTRLNQIEQSINENTINLLESQKLLESLLVRTDNNSFTAEAGSVLSDSPEYQKVINELLELEIQYKTLSQQLTDDHPKLIEVRRNISELNDILNRVAQSNLGSKLNSQVDISNNDVPYQNSLRKGLSQKIVETELEVKALRTRQEGLLDEQRRLRTLFSQLPQLTRQYQTVQRQLDLSNEQLNRFLKIRENLMLSLSREEIPWKIVAPVAVYEASSSSLIQRLILGSLLGVIFGIGLSLIVDRFYGVVFNLNTLTSLSKWPILASVPYVEELSYSLLRFFDTAKNSPMESLSYNYLRALNEIFRSCYSQIRLAKPDEHIQSIVVTSLIAEEGKTTVSLHLAEAAAAMGCRVLLVDADLRKEPTSLSDKSVPEFCPPGLSELVSEQATLSDLISEYDDYPNLYFLSSGLIPTDPAGLLGSNRMSTIMNEIKNSFDLIIYDSSPLLFADPLLLSSNCDGILLVTRLGYTPLSDFKYLDKRLASLSRKVLGVVANDVKNSSQQVYSLYAEGHQSTKTGNWERIGSNFQVR
ncbi:GumC family protein [Lyngbya confervoides]|uniref:Polysaccharide biosynthesis tyrosine autokinase n=1 Tax=Lyngbya confervoides BDU141951 TaxID=1574623 RepID=A0ABD4T8J3_9CYAN|nr:polysaccharide biosynthesis tyrosine autokinase [Lyngbya confervoides]MCM1984911.1 polysaccharide biosynthesis tyrosine autokinase [Lyngbya confervoides BDU141951]